MEHLREIPEVNHLLTESDYVDVKCVDGRAGIREFLAGMMSYHPFWLRGLYAVRRVVARVLHLPHSSAGAPKLTAEDVTLLPGDKLLFFTTAAAAPDRFWIGEVADGPMTSYLAVVAESAQDNGHVRFHVGTAVKFHNWRAPLYFNLIRPFHHVVVKQMARAGARATGIV